MRSLRRRRGSLRGVIWVAAGILAAVAIGVALGSLPISDFFAGQPTESTLTSNTPSGTFTEPGTRTPDPLSPGSNGTGPTVSVTLIGPPSAADAWANDLLDRVLDQLRASAWPGDGFAWWQGQEATGILNFTDQGLVFRGDPLSFNGQTSIGVYTVSEDNPNQTQQLGTLRLDSSALVINLSSRQPDQGEMQWILSGGQPDTAIQSLVIQAAARSVALKVAYNPDAQAGSAVLVLVGVQPLASVTPMPTQSGTPLTATPTSAAMTATPTHAPDESMGVVIESMLKPVIDIGLAFPQDVVDTYTAAHAWHGPLTWDETGPKVNDRPVNVNAATELTLWILTPNDPRGPAQTFLTLEYSGNATRFLEEQMYFTGQRMNEVLYWTVVYGARRGGTLTVTYDDFGSRQAITIVGFVPFIQPTATP